jgi:hypothetical protein
MSRGLTFGDFVTIRTEASMQDVTVARQQSTTVQNPSPPLLNVMYCVRVSLWTVKIFIVVGNLCIYLIFPFPAFRAGFLKSLWVLGTEEE